MKISQETISSLITFILGGGLAAFFTQLVRGWSALRTGSRASVREVVKDLAASRDDAETRAATKQRDLTFWRDIAGGYSYQLRSHGHTPDPDEPVPPSARERLPSQLRGPARRPGWLTGEDDLRP